MIAHMAHTLEHAHMEAYGPQEHTRTHTVNVRTHIRDTTPTTDTAAHSSFFFYFCFSLLQTSEHPFTRSRLAWFSGPKFSYQNSEE